MTVSRPRGACVGVAVAVAAVALATSARPAAARPHGPPGAIEAIPPPSPEPALELKSPSTAFGLAFGITLGGYAVGLAGAQLGEGGDHDGLVLAAGVVNLAALIVGPSSGHFYAGETDRGLTTTGLRVVATGAMAWGLIELFSCLFCEQSDVHPAAPIALLAGAGTLIGTMVYDIVDAPRAARRANRRAAARATELSVTPTLIRGGDAAGPGLVFAGRF